MLNETQIRLLNLIIENTEFGLTSGPPLGDIYGIQASKPYAIGTNGQYLLGYELPSLDDVKRLDVRAENIEAKIAKWLDYSEGLAEISFSALLAWCKKDLYLKCPCCDGTGERNIDLGKKFIEGNWIDRFEDIDNGSFAMLQGLPISRNLMIRTLAYLPVQERVMIGQIPDVLANKAGQPLLIIRGEGWVYVQCPLNSTPDEYEKLERFEAAL